MTLDILGNHLAFTYNDIFVSLGLILALVLNEGILSTDNAIALANIVSKLPEEKQQKALNIGLLISYAARVLMLFGATYILKYWQFQALGAAYLLWLVLDHFVFNKDDKDDEAGIPDFKTVLSAVPIIAFTDIAFSLDSITTAVAISKNMFIVVTGVTLGIILLRYMSNLFIKWLKEFTYLKDAGYVAVFLVSLKLINTALIEAHTTTFEFPELAFMGIILLVFVWGFSRKKTTINYTTISSND